jgi:hypothetical protein
MPRLYNEERLRLPERILRRKLEEYELVVKQLPASKNVNTEVEEVTVLEAVIRRQPMKIKKTEKTS